MTVGRALELPPLRHGLPEVLAGHESLERPIRWVHSAEVDNIAELLRGGELLLSTGMRISSEREAVRLVDQLGERGVAGIVIELGAALPAIPARMVEAAAAARLPLVCLHREVAFGEVTEAIHAEIVSHQLSVLRRTEAIHERFTRLMMGGGTLQSVLDELASVVANPVLLEDGDGALVYHACYRASDSTVLATWERRRLAPSDEGIVVPLPGSRTIGGRLIVLALDSELDELAPLAARRAAELVALALVRADHEEVLALDERGQFLEQVAGGGLEPSEAVAQARRLGFEPASRQLLPIVLSVAVRADRSDRRPAVVPLWRAVRRELGGAGVASLAGSCRRGSALLLLVAIADERRRAAVASHVAAISRKAAARALGEPHLLTVGVGAVSDWTSVSRELASAWRTADTARSPGPRGWCDATGPNLDRLLGSLAAREEVKRFVERRIGPLLDGGRRSDKLLETLATYFATGGRVSVAARRLRVGRQALYDRLATIEELLGADLADEDSRLGIGLAIRVHEYAADRPEATAGGRR